MPGRRGRRRRALSLRARLTLLLAGIAVLLAGTLMAQLVYQSRLVDERDALIHRVSMATESVGDLRAAILDQEGGLRDLALTGDDRFQARAEAGGDAADGALARLREVVGGEDGSESDLAAEITAARTTLSRWRRAADEAADEPNPQDPTAVDALLIQSDEEFDALRAAVDRLDAGLDDERAAGLAAIDRTYDRLLLAMIVQVAGVAFLGAVIAVALSRQVLAPLARLGRDARAVADGDLTRTVGVDGPPELVQIGEDVEAMRARIVAELDELTAARAELERQAEELARSNADLEQFAYVASHDLQEPLRKVSGFCQLLERRYGDQLDDRGREYLWYAADGAQRMQVLINALLAFARVGRTTAGFRPVDLGPVAVDAVEALAEPVRASRAAVTVGELPVVDGDPRLLAVVFQNLVGNAIKFRSEEPPRVEVTATCLDDEWTIKVSDNGIGVDPSHADEVFTLFGRLHHRSEYDGTGIGLALAKKIVEFHGGRIWLEPTSGPGTTFAFTLPTPK